MGTAVLIVIPSSTANFAMTIFFWFTMPGVGQDDGSSMAPKFDEVGKVMFDGRNNMNSYCSLRF